MSSNDPVGAPDAGGPTPEVTDGQRGIQSPHICLALSVGDVAGTPRRVRQGVSRIYGHT